MSEKSNNSNNVQQDQKKDKPSKRFSFRLNSSVFSLIILCLLMLSFVSLLNGGRPRSLGSLLEFLANTPDIIGVWSIPDWVEMNFPSWLSWLNEWGNFFTLVIRYCWAILGGAIQALSFIFRIVAWIFVG